MSETDSNTALVVEDDGPVRSMLVKYLSGEQFEVLSTGSAEEALRQLRSRPFAVMLCDIRLPGMSGVDLVPEALRIQPKVAILMLTGVNDAATAALCIQRGAMDYLTKPVDMETLTRAVFRALARRQQDTERRPSGKQARTEASLVQRERELLEQSVVAALEALVSAFEGKDQYLRGHSVRVADLSTAMAVQLEMGDEDVTWIRHAARLHDLGKIAIREELLDRQGPLTSAEYEQVKQHVIIGSEIVARLAYLGDTSAPPPSSPPPPPPPPQPGMAHLPQVVAFVRGHHERWDGKGYPDGLKGEQIPLGARIIGAAEIYDALTSPRPYQARITSDEALVRMGKMVGSVLDPKVFAALVAAGPERMGFESLE